MFVARVYSFTNSCGTLHSFQVSLFDVNDNKDVMTCRVRYSEPLIWGKNGSCLNVDLYRMNCSWPEALR